MAFTLPIRDSVLTRNVKCSGKLREELNRADIHALRSTMRSLKIRKKNVYGLCALRLWISYGHSPDETTEDNVD